MDLAALFRCRRIAVVGASRDPEKVGHQILKQLQKNTALKLFPINPHASTLLGLQTNPSILDVHQKIEVVFVAIPFEGVERVVDECIQIQVGAVVILSSGFAEASVQGKIVQERIAQKLYLAHVLLLGPNTMGYIVPFQNLYASFGAEQVPAGPVGLISQSGAMLSALFQEYASANTGVSFAVSLGNRAGIDEHACLEYAATDPHTRAVVMYMESFRDIPTLLKLASSIAKTKPIFLLKGGTTVQGVAAAVSHTAALATPQALLRDATRQAGIVLVENFEQLVRASVASAKAAFLPENLAVVTNAGGPSVVLVDELASSRVQLAVPSPKTREALADRFPKLHVANPFDLLGDASAKDFDDALTVLSKDLAIDAIACVVTQQSVTDMENITKVLSKPRGKRLMLACLAGGDQLELYRTQLKKAGVLVTTYPNEIVETMAALTEARQNMEGTHQFPAKFSHAQTHQYPQSFTDLQTLLQAYGLKFPNQMVIDDQQNLEKLSTLQFPLVAKTTDLTLKHKAKIGAVITNIHDVDQARVAYEKLKAWKSPVAFQETVVGDLQALVGFVKDVQFGWYVAVGLGGSLSDTLEDRAYCFLPAQKTVLEHTLDRTKLGATLTPNQKEHLLDILGQLQRCVLETLNLIELEINPLFLTKDGPVVADMKRG